MAYGLTKNDKGKDRIEKRYIAFAWLWFDAFVKDDNNPKLTLDGILIVLRTINNFNPIQDSFRYAIDDEKEEVYVIRNDDSNTVILTVKKIADN